MSLGDLAPSHNADDGSHRAGNQPFDQDPDLWLKDGSLIIVCGSNGFRVNEGVLSFSSPVFRDMIASSSALCGETHEGCPVVRLTDSPIGMRDFLMMLYDRRLVSTLI